MSENLIMAKVKAYVDAWFGERNFSYEIERTIKALGATITTSLTKDTTHVIFSNGAQSTFDIATAQSIPIVSPKWVDDSVRNANLMDPSEYKIHNFDIYTNAASYPQFKIIKFYRHNQTQTTKQSQQRNVE